MKVFSNFDSLGKKIVGFVILAVGLSLLFLLIRNGTRDLPIWFFGRSGTGLVEAKWYELIEENKGEMVFEYFLRYSFSTPEGEILTGSTRLSAQEWMMYIEGGEVPIVYSSLNPSNNRVDDSRFKPLLLCSYIPFILITWFTLFSAWNILSSEFAKNKTYPWVAKS